MAWSLAKNLEWHILGLGGVHTKALVPGYVAVVYWGQNCRALGACSSSTYEEEWNGMTVEWNLRNQFKVSNKVVQTPS